MVIEKDLKLIMEHKKFAYRHLDELREDIFRSGVDLPVSEHLDILKSSMRLNKKTLPNRLVVHPMDGYDGTDEGIPGELTFRRYKRFGAGGAGLLWMEACAVTNEGRANPRQIYIKYGNVPEFKKLFNDMMNSAKTAWGDNFNPYTVLQLSHSGRYCKSHTGASAIVAVAENPYLDPFTNPKKALILDRKLERLEDKYVYAAILAKEIGFDAVDIKACHRYLNSELLSAHTRKGKYGGSFRNRTRFLLNIIDKIKANVDIDITLRINAYDAIPYPYGWGTDENGQPALDEPRQLMKILKRKGVRLINISTGNPYYNPHIGRPSDIGPYVAPEHPIESASRMLQIVREMKKAAPSIAVIGTGFSWFREYGANIAAGCIEQGWMDLAGFGRQAFAYPDFAKDLLTNGGMQRSKCCTACTKCTELMRYDGQTGCVVKDRKLYLPIWRKATNGQTIMNDKIDSHV